MSDLERQEPILAKAMLECIDIMRAWIDPGTDISARESMDALVAALDNPTVNPAIAELERKYGKGEIILPPLSVEEMAARMSEPPPPTTDYIFERLTSAHLRHLTNLAGKIPTQTAAPTNTINTLMSLGLIIPNAMPGCYATTDLGETIIEMGRQQTFATPAVSASAVDHPAHYGGADNPYEAIKVIESWGLGFNLGNTVKYIARAEHKGATVQDLEKSSWYLTREINRRKIEDLVK